MSTVSSGIHIDNSGINLWVFSNYWLPYYPCFIVSLFSGINLEIFCLIGGVMKYSHVPIRDTPDNLYGKFLKFSSKIHKIYFLIIYTTLSFFGVILSGINCNNNFTFRVQRQQRRRLNALWQISYTHLVKSEQKVSFVKILFIIF